MRPRDGHEGTFPASSTSVDGTQPARAEPADPARPEPDHGRSPDSPTPVQPVHLPGRPGGDAQLTLLQPAAPSVPDPEPAPGQPLWMAVYLPHLALDALARTGAARTEPLIVAEHGARPRVHDANRAARRAGIFPGMALADALAVLNAPAVVDHQPEALHAQLQTLATVLIQFSDHVCPEPDQRRILLEIGRSLRLFRGAEALCRQIRDTLRNLGYSPRIGVARTPAAARLLAALPGSARPADRDSLRRTLSPLPLTTLPLPEPTIAALRDVGLNRIGELLRFPSADLALRYGAALPELLARLLGDAPEALPRFQPPDDPFFQVEFDREVTSAGALRFPLKRLLLQMEQVLRARHRAVQGLELRLAHRETVTVIALERSRPGSRAEEWLELWNIRLSRLALPAPVLGMRLAAARLLPAAGDAAGLFGGSDEALEEAGLLARMRARLGDGAVLRFTPTLHPLPELAQAEWKADEANPAAPPVATPAQRAAGAALWLQPLQPCAPPVAPEWLGRLEGGWWADGNDQRRDYALARDHQGRLCWIFRDLRSGEWRLQGLWG
jgi:protein ImuB